MFEMCVQCLFAGDNTYSWKSDQGFKLYNKHLYLFPLLIWTMINKKNCILDFFSKQQINQAPALYG